MSGWDTPSRPTWDPQDGPEDGTQAFPAADSSGADDRWSRPVGPGWGGSGSADGQDFGRADFGAPELGAPDFGPPDTPPSEFFTQAFEQRQPGATLAGRELPGRGRYETGPQASARDEPPWPGPARQESSRQESARQQSARPDYGRTGEYGRQDLGRPDLDRPAAPGQDFPGQDFPRRDPGRADFSAYSTYSGQPDQAEQAPPAAYRADGEVAARMDPALQDFFAPTKPDPRYSSARPNRAAQPPGLPNPGQPGPGQPDPGQPDPGQPYSRQPRPGLPGPGQPRPGLPGPGQPRQRSSDTGPIPRRRDDGSGPQLLPLPAGARDQGGQRRPRSHDGRGDANEPATGGKGQRIIAVGAVAVVVLAGGAYLLLHKSSNSNNNNAAANTTPTSSAPASSGSTATAKPKTKETTNKSGVTSSPTSSAGYLLSAPSTAAGYPIGTDPKFLATTKSTVSTIEQSAVSGGGGKVSGSPVAASYTLPDAQTIEFVGYQGTFNPSKVMTNLGSFGTSEATYPAGPNGGELACANTTATSTTPSGAVCVWVTKSTLGFTEFFTQASGPEALNSAQSKGAEDTVNLRASVEKLKSGSQ
jgi:hypothetical protein